MPKVSVLTAVYNTAKFLHQCLESLSVQTLSDCEFICIDDCSTDNSLDILNEYAVEDSRFKVIHLEENQGQAVARNKGLELATGEYITMLDSDDWYAPDTLEKAYKALKDNQDADCVMLRLMQWYDKDNVVPFPNKVAEDVVMSGEEAFRLSLDWSIHGLYLVRASIHKQYPYDTATRLYSDDNTTRLHYLHSNKVVQCSGEYFYRKHSESMTNACSIRRFDYLEANYSMKQQLIGEKVDEKVLTFYENHRWLNLIAYYRYYKAYEEQFSRKEKAEIYLRINTMLKTIEKERIYLTLKLKPWYYPYHSFRLFVFWQKIRSLAKGSWLR